MKQAVKNLRRITARVVIVFTALVVSSCAPEGADQSAAIQGKPAADFSLTSLDNHQVKLSDLKGKVVVLDFWATWCPPCRASLPNLNRLSTDPNLAARGLKVLAVNAQESAADVSSFMASNHYSFPVLLDPDGTAERAYGVDGLPTSVVIGRGGTVKFAVVGLDPQGDETPLNDAVEKALSEAGK